MKVNIHLHALVALPPGKVPSQYLLDKGLGGPYKAGLGTMGQRKKYLAPVKNRNPAVHAVACHYNNEDL